MSTYYFDSSALVKAYITEPGSEQVISLIDTQGPQGQQHQILFAKIGIVEVVAAMAKRRRMRDISTEQQSLFIRAFLRDCQVRFATTGINDATIRLATDLTQRHPLRGYDAVHLATALLFNQNLLAVHLPPLVFVSADRTLNDAARTEGLPVITPGSTG